MMKPEPLAPLAPPPGRRGLPLARWFVLAGMGSAFVFVLGVTAILLTLTTTREARQTLVDVIDPATLRTLEISTALQAQEGAIRAYGLTTDQQYLEAYRQGVAAEQTATAAFTTLIPRLPEAPAVRAGLDRLTAASAEWRRDYADKIVAAVPSTGTRALNRDSAKVNVELFARVRTALDAQESQLNRLHDIGRNRLYNGWNTIYVAVGALVAAVVAAVIGCALIVRRVVLGPVARLGEQVRTVAAGDFDHELGVDRPYELRELSGHVDGMRRRIVDEWRAAMEARRQLSDQTRELTRSNGELEQFAYVASHDLQEPLRKVASFTQLLEQRYGDQLDDRGRQYIAFAVDGAKRMQLLINDLLDFSRVGRVGGDLHPVRCADALEAALHNLDALLSDADAVVTHDDLPEILGNVPLLTQLFQNLVANAVKFRSADPPRIHIGVRRDGVMWEFSCADNGIGVDPRYADRIFLIFQRLHPRDVYPGSGIGLALCRKIVEYHGGRIWLDSGEGPGATFRWTLPAVGEPDA
ncbi:sensor histidine kinase [Planotetraspora kaengkrachanensis]|uniref:histidine kinase n=1 Tax=Planotetraspora kaengkrachanensis TaxID=575193 RepID=A0A8J3PTC2_9ACTN|nr:sensor histidine kinase [Planotetraspora kaengkrachanensis]GIG80223.1 histidine kinase [Planotetraspora kaengkrachanensis]